MNVNLQIELENIYKALDVELGGHNIECKSCGTCCDFEKFDHVLYVSMIEADYILSNIKMDMPELVSSACPFQIDSKCTERSLRALGCRVFYCDKGYVKDVSPILYDKYYGKIKELSLKYNINWEYRPLIEFLTGKVEKNYD